MSRALSLVFAAHQPAAPPGDDWARDALVGAACTAYLPLLRTLARCAVEGWSPGVAVALSPELIAALEAPENVEAVAAGLRERVRGWEREAAVHQASSPYRELAERYATDLQLLERVFEAVDGRIGAGFESHRDDGRIELLDVPAGHSLAPLRTPAAPALAFDGPANGARGALPPGLALTAADARAFAKRGLRYAVVDGRALGATPRPGPAVLDDGFVLLPADGAARARLFGFLADPAIEGLRRAVSPRAALGSDVRLAITEGALHARGPHRLPYRHERAAAVASEWAGDFVAALTADPGNDLCLLAFDLEELGARWFDAFTLVEALAARCAAPGGATLVSPGAWLGVSREGHAGQPVLRTEAADGFLGDWLGAETVWALARCHELATAWRAVRGALSEDADSAIASALRAASDASWLRRLRSGDGAEHAAERIRAHLDEGWSRLRGL